MTLPNNPSDGTIAFIDGSEFVFDATENRWLVSRSRSEIELDSDFKRSLDSEVNVLRGFFYKGAQSAGYPVGSVIAFAHHNLPDGFRIADGSEFNINVYPALYERLGTNLLPDLRGQFLRGHSDDNSVDPEGPREAGDTQTDSFKSHNHSASTTTRHKDTNWDWTLLADGTLSKASLSGTVDTSTSVVTTYIYPTGGSETRPKNTAVVLAIAMYDGAGLNTDSELMYAALQLHVARFDSDIAVLQNRLLVLDSETDSDIGRAHHHFNAADSDLSDRISLEAHDRQSGDSDLQTQITETINTSIALEVHNRESGDSDLQVQINDTIANSINVEVTNRTNADIALQTQVDALFARTDSDEMQIQYILGELSRRMDSDIVEKLRDDSDLKSEVLKLIDSDFLNFSSDISALENTVNVTLSNNIAQVTHDREAGDSDLQQQITVTLSTDIAQVTHDRQAGDSDLQQQITVTLSTDIAQVTHDRAAGDSDLLDTINTTVNTTVATEIHDRIAGDSELQVQITETINTTVAVEVHDRRAADSDLSDRISSDVAALQLADQAILYDLDSEVNLFRAFQFAGAQSAGFPVGSIIPYANGSMGQGFILADGSTFNALVYPELAAYLGGNVLPDYTGRQLGYKEYNWPQSFDSDSDFSSYEVVFGIAAYNGAGLFTDSDLINNILGVMTAEYDSEIIVLKDRNTQLEARATELEGDLAQAIADRVFTDNQLSARLNDHDSDIALRGRFYVQPTPPSGGPNSGWVNTNNMRLHVWDVSTGTWTEVVTT